MTAPRGSRALRATLRSVARILGLVATVLLAAHATVLVVFTQPTLGKLRPSVPGDADPAALEGHVRFLCEDALPRDSDHPANLDFAAAYIADHLRVAGGRVGEQIFDARGRTYRNVTGSFGPDGGSILLIGAHYDAFGILPGADDNASGVSVLLEVGRMLGRTAPPARVDLTAFTLEEPPFFAQEEMGSAVSARSLRAAGASLSGMISLEMLGCYADEQPWPSGLLSLVYPNEGDFLLVVGRQSDRRLSSHAKRAMRGSSPLRIRTFVGPRMDGMDASDHRSFWDEGFRAIMITDTAYIRNPRYHTRDDVPESLDYARMAQAADGVYGIAMTSDRLAAP